MDANSQPPSSGGQGAAPHSGLNEDTVFTGFMLGLIVGGIAALFRGPRLHVQPLGGMITRLQRQSREIGATTSKGLRDKLEAVIPADPISDSIAEGKAAARRRRVNLGLDSGG